MNYRTLGASPIKVSSLALGGNIFGCFCNEGETRQLLDLAHELGVNVVDTADVYSDGVSENYIGRCLQGKRQDWIIATKVGVPSHGSRRGMAQGKKIIEKLEGSLRRLRTDHVDLYQLHHFDPETPLEETVRALDSLLAQGKFRYVGVSNYSSNQLFQFVEQCSASLRRAFVSIQIGYNLFKRAPEQDLFPACRDHDIGVIPYGVLARGVLTGKYSWGGAVPAGSRAVVSESIRSDLREDVLSCVDTLEQYAKQIGKSVVGLALSWVLRRPEVGCAVLGIRNAEQLRENVSASETSLSDEEWERVDEILGDLGKFGGTSLGETASLIANSEKDMTNAA